MTGVFILARLGSTRLLEKHLIEAAGKPFIEWLTKRISFEFKDEAGKGLLKVFICTGDEEANRRFEALALPGVSVYYGNINNIPVRIFKCAEENHIDKVIMVDGDDILVSMTGLRKIYTALDEGHMQVKTNGLPFGMNSMGFHINVLEQVYQLIKDKRYLETGWGRFFEQDKYQTVNFGSEAGNKDLRFTLDYEEDRQFFTEILLHFQDTILEADDTAILAFVRQNSLNTINACRHEEYWNNFNSQILKENNNG